MMVLSLINLVMYTSVLEFSTIKYMIYSFNWLCDCSGCTGLYMYLKTVGKMSLHTAILMSTVHVYM